jgi:hypothetical protein
MDRSKVHVALAGLQIGCINPLAMFTPGVKLMIEAFGKVRVPSYGLALKCPETVGGPAAIKLIITEVASSGMPQPPALPP